MGLGHPVNLLGVMSLDFVHSAGEQIWPGVLDGRADGKLGQTFPNADNRKAMFQGGTRLGETRVGWADLDLDFNPAVTRRRDGQQPTTGDQTATRNTPGLPNSW